MARPHHLRPRLLVDVRERSLWDAIQQRRGRTETNHERGETGETGETGEVQKALLDLGDVQILNAEEEEVHGESTAAQDAREGEHEGEHEGEGKEKRKNLFLVVERKTLSDFCASLKDGRFKEQKFRLLQNAAVRGAHIAYIVEGYDGFAQLAQHARRNGLHPTALQSCVYNLMFLSDVHVLFTRDVEDSADVVIGLWSRHLRRIADDDEKGVMANNGGRRRAQTQAQAAPSGGEAEEAHMNVACAKKNKNITPRLCYLMQLCQVPGVSSKTAKIVAERWSSMSQLFADLQGKSQEERVREMTKLPTLGKKNALKIVEHLFVDH